MKPKKLAKGMGYFNDYNEFGKGKDLGVINFDGDTLKSTREILDGKDCIVSRITDKNGNTRISQIEYPLIYFAIMFVLSYLLAWYNGYLI